MPMNKDVLLVTGAGQMQGSMSSPWRWTYLTESPLKP